MRHVTLFVAVAGMAVMGAVLLIAARRENNAVSRGTAGFVFIRPEYVFIESLAVAAKGVIVRRLCRGEFHKPLIYKDFYVDERAFSFEFLGAAGGGFGAA
ncbi:hypothetical protein HC761_00425 [bacterium]|nr:hypothetical protein [bacterium]